MIVVDTSILSLAYRRRTKETALPREAQRLGELIEAGEPQAVPGIVLQEILSATRSTEQFRRLSDALAGFALILADRALHLRAARLSNECREAGVQAATVDCLIAAMALEHGRSLFTADREFDHIARVSGLPLFR